MVEYVPDMHIVERSSRSVRISADWCSGSTPDSDSGDIGPIPVLAAKDKEKEVKIMKRLTENGKSTADKKSSAGQVFWF